MYPKALFAWFFYALLALLFSQPTDAFAQTFGPIDDRFETIQGNSVSSLDATDSVLWMAPGLNAYSEITGEIFIPQNADSLYNARGRAFSLAVDGSRILAGLGFTSTAGGTNVNAAQGYYQSFDNGQNWQFLPFFLDERPSQSANCDGSSIGPPCDIEFEYGGKIYNRLRIIVPEESPPFEVDFYGETLFSVNFASGLLRSTDSGQTWERIMLPPSFENELVPDSTYQWFSQTSGGEVVNRYDPRFDTNLLGFGLLIDDNQRVWVGTASGVNISENALTAPADRISWRRISFDPDSSEGLLGNWIIKIRQQPGTDRIWMTNWRADPENRDQFGLVYTSDGGETFSRFLEGIRVNDIGFFEDTIFAPADNGLYISDDGGASWHRVDQIRSPNSFIREDARYFAAAATDQQMWIGTNDGIASTSDGGQNWQIIRVDMPLAGGNIYQPDAPRVETYAYPNPFSPAVHSLVRIKYELQQASPATIRIFDFGMNPVRTLRVEAAPASGSYETIWNGTDDTGRLVANGTYFYSIETQQGSAEGKILLLD